MADTPHSPEYLELVEEDARLVALQAICDVALERDPLADEWVLSITPNTNSPSFQPYRRFNVPGAQINGAIREGWGVVARAAQQENENAISLILNTLEPTIPVEVGHEPAMSQWLPTDLNGKWESAQNYVIWNIGAETITRLRRFAYLRQLPDGFHLILPDEREVKINLKQSSKHTFRIPDTKADVIQARKDHESSTDTATGHHEPLLKDQIFKETRDQLEQVIQGRNLFALLDEDEDIRLPKIYGLILGLSLGFGLLIYFFSIGNDTAPVALILACVFVWILKRIIIFIFNR